MWGKKCRFSSSVCLVRFWDLPEPSMVTRRPCSALPPKGSQGRAWVQPSPSGCLALLPVGGCRAQLLLWAGAVPLGPAPPIRMGPLQSCVGQGAEAGVCVESFACSRGQAPEAEGPVRVATATLLATQALLGQGTAGHQHGRPQASPEGRKGPSPDFRAMSGAWPGMGRPWPGSLLLAPGARWAAFPRGHVSVEKESVASLTVVPPPRGAESSPWPCVACWSAPA